MRSQFDQGESRPRILVIDNDQSVLGLVEAMLLMAGYEVHTASTGIEAIERVIGSLSPDLVISDYHMPGMNGLEVIQRIRTLVRTQLPSLVITGSAADAFDPMYVSSSVWVLKKPFERVELYQIVSNALDFRRSPTPP